MQVHHVRVIFPRSGGERAAAGAVPLLARQQLLVHLVALLCDFEAAAAGSEAPSQIEFEPRPGYVYGMDGHAQFKERGPDVPPLSVYVCMVNDDGPRKEVEGGEGGPDIAEDCREYLAGDEPSQLELDEEEGGAAEAVPGDMAWDPQGRQLWLGVSRAPQREAGFGGVTGVAGGVEVVGQESWGIAVSIIGAIKAGHPVPPSPCPTWLVAGAAAPTEAEAAAAEEDTPEKAAQRAMDETALAEALGLGFVTVDPETLGGAGAMAWYDGWLAETVAMASLRRGLARETVSNMRQAEDKEKGAQQRKALQRVGLLVDASAVSAAAGSTLNSRQPLDEVEAEPEPEPEPEPIWLRNRAKPAVDVHAEPAMGEQGDRTRPAGAEAVPPSGGWVAFVTVSDTLVLRCSTSCPPAELWRYVTRGEDGGDEAGAAAEQEQKLAERALQAVTTTRQALGLGSLRCADGLEWQTTLAACDRLRGRAKRLRPVLAGVKMELVESGYAADGSGGYVVPDFEIGVLKVDVGARLT